MMDGAKFSFENVGSRVCYTRAHCISIIFAINVFLSNILIIMFLKQRPHGCFNNSINLWQLPMCISLAVIAKSMDGFNLD